MAQTLTLVELKTERNTYLHMCPGADCGVCRWAWVTANGPTDVDERRLMWKKMRVTPYVVVARDTNEA